MIYKKFLLFKNHKHTTTPAYMRSHPPTDARYNSRTRQASLCILVTHVYQLPTSLHGQ
jgi:hypothetical protein